MKWTLATPRFAVLRFAIVGSLAFALDGGLLMLCERLGLGLYLGRALSLSASVLFTYFLNRSFTFRSATLPSWAEFGLYVHSVIKGTVLNYGLYGVGIYLSAHPIVSLALATLASATFNFFQFRKVFALDKNPADR